MSCGRGAIRRAPGSPTPARRTRQDPFEWRAHDGIIPVVPGTVELYRGPVIGNGLSRTYLQTVSRVMVGWLSHEGNSHGPVDVHR